MKLRSAKYSSMKKSLSNATVTNSGKLKQQSKAANTLGLVSSEVDSSAENKSNRSNLLSQKYDAMKSSSCATYSNDTSVKTVGQQHSSSNFSTRAKRLLMKNDKRASNFGSSSTLQSDVSTGEVEGKETLVIDTTKEVNRSITMNQQSLNITINNPRPDATRMEAVNGLQIEKVGKSKKNRKRNRSVEAVCRNVKPKLSATVSSPTNKQTEQVNDDCSIISVLSDEEIIVLDTTPKAKLQLNLNSTSDVIVLDTPTPKRQSGCEVIDLCSPLNSSAQFEQNKGRPSWKGSSSQRSPKVPGSPRNSSKIPVSSQSSSRVSGSPQNSSNGPSSSHNSAFSEYISVLGRENAKTNAELAASGYHFAAYPAFPAKQPLSSSTNKYSSKTQKPNPDAGKKGLRPIVIDGSNVAMGHSNGRIFSSRGLQICIDRFLSLNHKVIAFVPKFRKSSFHSTDKDILDKLEKEGLVAFTPSRKIGNRLVVSYDDRFIVQYAAECGGVIVSTDNYRDLLEENPSWRETIENRLLMFTWVGDEFMLPQDPLGRYGPSLAEFLRFPP